MKQLIVLLATIPLTLLLIMQVSHEQINMSKLVAVERVVEISEDQAKRDGYFTEANKNQLKDDLKRILELDDTEITFTMPGQTEIKYRAEQMHYKIEMPFKNIMVGNEILGIRDENNVSNIVIERDITSEKLKP